MKHPELRDVPVSHGKGKSVVSGTVDLLFADSDRVRVDTRNNHAPTFVNFRDKEWTVTAWFLRQADGTWTHDPERGQYVSRRQMFGRLNDAPNSYRAAILAAALDLVSQHWTEEFGRQARHADAVRKLADLEPKRVKAAEELAAIDSRMAELRAIVEETRNPAATV